MLDDIAHRVGLAGPGRSVQQQAALEVAPSRQELVPSGSDVQGVPVDPSQNVFGQDDVGSLRAGQRGEQDLRPAVAFPELEQLTAVHIELVPQLLEPAEDLLSLSGRKSRYLERETGLMHARAAHENDVAAALVLDQQQRQAVAPEGLAAGDRTVDEVGRAQPQGRHVAVDQLMQPHPAEVRGQRQPVNGVRPAGFGEPSVEGHLQVRVLERRKGRGDDGLVHTATEVSLDEVDHRVLAWPAVGVHPLEERAERGRELARLLRRRPLVHRSLQVRPSVSGGAIPSLLMSTPS